MHIENPTPWKLYDYVKKKPIREFKTYEQALIARVAYSIKNKTPIDKIAPVYCPHIPPPQYVRRQRPFSEALK